MTCLIPPFLGLPIITLTLTITIIPNRNPNPSPNINPDPDPDADPDPDPDPTQVYIKFPSGAGEPPSQLKGFQKVGPLDPGAKETVTIDLSQRSFSTWDVQSHSWKVEHGEFEVMVGRSSRDFRLTSKITI